MSIDTVNLYNEKKKELIEDGSNSEPGIYKADGVVATSTINGIFDEHYMKAEKDSGNVPQQFKKPRFFIDALPAGLVPGTSVMEIRSVDYIIIKPGGTDKNGFQVLWLKVK